MTLISWANALLQKYWYLKMLAQAIDEKVNSLTLMQSINGVTTFELSNKIIDLIEKKISVINSKVLVEQILKQLDTESAKILILKFVDRVSFCDMLNILNINYRTLYRKIQRAKIKFAQLLKINGYTEDKLAKLLKNYEWLFQNDRRRVRISKNLTVDYTDDALEIGANVG